MRYKKGQAREEMNLGMLEDLISPDHYIRLLAAFVEGCVKANESLYSNKGKSHTGQKPYGAVTLLLLYIYGYLNRITSSRRLEAEANRNIEVIWLLGGLRPDFKTIADYRKDQGHHIRHLLKLFNTFLKEQKYIEGKGVSIDGMRTKANTRRAALSLKKISSRLDKLDSKLNSYLKELQINDEKEEALIRLDRLEIKEREALEKIAQLQQEIEALQKKKRL